MDGTPLTAAPRLSIHRPLVGPVQVFVPYGDGDSTREWFRTVTNAPAMKLRWEHSAPAHWVVGRDRLVTVAFAIVEKFGYVDLHMDYRLSEKCGLKCKTSVNPNCTCSCLGATHGGASQLNFLPIAEVVGLTGTTVQTLRTLTR